MSEPSDLIGSYIDENFLLVSVHHNDSDEKKKKLYAQQKFMKAAGEKYRAGYYHDQVIKSLTAIKCDHCEKPAVVHVYGSNCCIVHAFEQVARAAHNADLGDKFTVSEPVDYDSE